jgi:hypothetical protein
MNYGMKDPVKRLRFNDLALKVFGLRKKPGISFQKIFDAMVEEEWRRVNKKRSRLPF